MNGLATRLMPGRASGVLAVACVALATLSLGRQLAGYSPLVWPQALFDSDPADIQLAVVHYSWLPRLCVSLLASGALALAGVLMQQVLFPREIPAGLISALLGGAYFMWGLRRL